MVDFPLLTLMTFLPLIGAVFIFLIRGDRAVVARNAKYAALYTSLFTLVLAIFMLVKFEPSAAGFQFEETVEWFPTLGIKYHMGVDGISLFFIALSALLTPICILASWESITLRVKEYMIAFLLLETFMIGTFAALDAVLFYVFFEGVLIPMFLIIGIWGGERRVYSAFKFFLFTLLGSVLMLVALLTLFFKVGTTDIPTLMENPVAGDLQMWLWLAFFASFAVKMPMWPVHTWLPGAHVEAPTAGSVILAGVLFLCVGVVYDRMHTRQIDRYGGLVKNMPRYATVFMIFTLGAVGLPGTSGFVGEFLTLVGAYQVNTFVATLAGLGIILGAIYMLYLYRRVVFGKLENEDVAEMPDLYTREVIILVPLALITLALGIFPNYVLDRTAPAVRHVIELYQAGQTGELTGGSRNVTNWQEDLE